jgi:hypothetical protein
LWAVLKSPLKKLREATKMPKKKRMGMKKAMMATKKKMSAVGQKLNMLRKNGVRKITLYYTREVNGKRVPNYKTIALTSAVIAAAGAGAYAYRKHKKHGHVIQRKKK